MREGVGGRRAAADHLMDVARENNASRASLNSASSTPAVAIPSSEQALATLLLTVAGRRVAALLQLQ